MPELRVHARNLSGAGGNWLMPTPVAPRFGRLIAPDVRDRKFRMRTLIPMPTVTSRIWSFDVRHRLDQEGPTCVGHGWAHFLACAPRRHAIEHDDAYQIYNRAQQIDEWEGEDYFGTSVRGGAKACVEFGFIEGTYVWGFTETEVRNFVLTRGPIVIGTTWFAGMMDTDARGYIHATGGEEGGHCVALNGYSASRDAYRGINSWTGFGDQGRFWLSATDFKMLLEGLGGEAASAVEVAG